jgi:ribose 5-phosphate isomerase A
MLGAYPLPIEVNPFGLEATRRLVEKACGGAEVKLRRKGDGSPVMTDGGHLILDARMGRIDDPEALDLALHRVPGVVEHGLFIGLCSAAYLASPDGVAVLGRTA